MKDENYLDEQFPKGETKFRGQAMVLLALARLVGKQEAQELFKKKIKEFDKKLRDILYLSKKGKGENNDDIYELIEELEDKK